MNEIEQLTQEEIESSVSAAFDSVNLINNIVLGTETNEESIEEKKYSIDSNIRHLQIMNNKEWFADALEEDQVTQIADCIVSGTSFIDSN